MEILKRAVAHLLRGVSCKGQTRVRKRQGRTRCSQTVITRTTLQIGARIIKHTRASDGQEIIALTHINAVIGANDKDIALVRTL